IGETLGMMWAASQSDLWEPPAEFAGRSLETNTSTTLREHVARNVATSLKFWRSKGPSSALRRDGSAQGLQYLQGLATYIERVYGTDIIGRTSTPLINKAVS